MLKIQPLHDTKKRWFKCMYSVAAAFLCERGRENAELRLISPTNQTAFM